MGANFTAHPSPTLAGRTRCARPRGRRAAPFLRTGLIRLYNQYSGTKPDEAGIVDLRSSGIFRHFSNTPVFEKRRKAKTAVLALRPEKVREGLFRHPVGGVLGLGLMLLLHIPPAWPAHDLAREKNWADEIVDTIMVGEPVWLEADKSRFLGLYAPPAAGTDAQRHAVILVHGRGVHPAWGFIENLRVDLSELGWHTLSLQMPVLAPDAQLKAYGETFPEAIRRIDSGIDYLKTRGITSVVLLGHSTGATTAMAYAAERPQAPLAGVIALSLSTVRGGNRYMQPALSLEKIRRPVLDIFGSEDIPEVLHYNEIRAQAAKKSGNPAYRQVRIKHTNHFYTDAYEDLKKLLVAWLKQHQ